MAYRMVYLRVRSSGYSFGWTSDTDQAPFREESRRLYLTAFDLRKQELSQAQEQESEPEQTHGPEIGGMDL